MEFKAERKFIYKMLSDENVKFVIPKYQRPYRWIIDQCETLWNDINEAFNEDKEYFLGSIVAFKNDRGEFEIIDGQQRITTFTLLFRAFYARAIFEIGDGLKEDSNYIRKFGECIWKQKGIDDGFDFSDFKLQSQIISQSEDNKILKEILSDKFNVDELEKLNSKKSKDSKYAKSNYAINFNYFANNLKASVMNFSNWKDIANFLLDKKLFVLFVECDSKESAMKIFNTLNSRGMPLSNADMLKGEIYEKIKNEEERKSFADKWEELEDKIKNNGNVKNLDFIFLQYMHIIRAINEDADTTTPGLLDFFKNNDEQNNKTTKKRCWGGRQKWLEKPETIPFVEQLTNFWCSPEDYLNEKSMRYLNVLNLFLNSSWKSFVSCLVWKNKEIMDNKEAFSKDFEVYLPKLIKIITIEFLQNNATTNVIDQITFKLNVELFSGSISMPNKFDLPFDTFKHNTDANKSSFYAQKAKYLLALYAYIFDNFESDIGDIKKLEIEHILPKQWQNANFNDWNEGLHKEYIEQIGNKILLPKKSNIKCSDNFFARKQDEYKKCHNLKEVLELGTEKQNWDKGDIDSRNEEIYNRLKDFCDSF